MGKKKHKFLSSKDEKKIIEAIQKAVEKAKTAAEEAVGKVQQELRTYQNKSANDIWRRWKKVDRPDRSGR